MIAYIIKISSLKQIMSWFENTVSEFASKVQNFALEQTQEDPPNFKPDATEVNNIFITFIIYFP